MVIKQAFSRQKRCQELSTGRKAPFPWWTMAATSMDLRWGSGQEDEFCFKTKDWKDHTKWSLKWCSKEKISIKIFVRRNFFLYNKNYKTSWKHFLKIIITIIFLNVSMFIVRNLENTKKYKGENNIAPNPAIHDHHCSHCGPFSFVFITYFKTGHVEHFSFIVFFNAHCNPVSSRCCFFPSQFTWGKNWALVCPSVLNSQGNVGIYVDVWCVSFVLFP